MIVRESHGSAPLAAPAPPSAPAPDRRRATIFPSATTLLALFLLSAILLAPALRNGYPLLYSDSGEYLFSAFTLRAPLVRPVGYGLWIFATGGTLTAWAPIVAQTLLLAALLVRTLRAVGVALTRDVLLVVALALLLTGAPWMASEMMPDVFAGAVLLALYLVTAHWARLGVVWRWIAGAAIVVGCATHVTLSVIAGALLLVALLLRRARSLSMPSSRALARGAALVALSVASLTLFNWARSGRATVTRQGGIFVIGHLVESGLAERVLGERCGVERFALCPWRAGLTQPIDRFVWDHGSPLYQAYESEAEVHDEARHLALAILVHEPLRLAASVVSYTARQLVNVQVFDGPRTHPVATYTASVVALVLPHEVPAMRTARQQSSGTPETRSLDALFLAAYLVSLLAALLTLRSAWRSGRLRIECVEGLQLFVLVALVVDAAVCANLSGVFGRYEERFAWLLPVLVAAALAARGGAAAPPEVAAGK